MNNSYFSNYIPINNITDITLLSKNEAEQLDQSILEAPRCWWWLQEPGHFRDYVMFVRYDDYAYVYDIGSNVNADGGGIRPALQISNLENLKIGDLVNCLGMKWYYVGDNLILCQDIIGKHCFNKDRSKHNANVFEGSDIQKLLKEWLQDKLTKIPIFYLHIIPDDNFPRNIEIATCRSKNNVIEFIKENPDDVDEVYNAFTGQIVQIKR